MSLNGLCLTLPLGFDLPLGQVFPPDNSLNQVDIEKRVCLLESFPVPHRLSHRDIIDLKMIIMMI